MTWLIRETFLPPSNIPGLGGESTLSHHVTR